MEPPVRSSRRRSTSLRRCVLARNGARFLPPASSSSTDESDDAESAREKSETVDPSSAPLSSTVASTSSSRSIPRRESPLRLTTEEAERKARCVARERQIAWNLVPPDVVHVTSAMDRVVEVEKLEWHYASCEFVKQIMVYADCMADRPIGITVLRVRKLENLASSLGISGDRTTLAGNKVIRQHVLCAVNAVGKKAGLESHELLEAVVLCDTESTQQNGMLVLNKRATFQKYQQRIMTMLSKLAVTLAAMAAAAVALSQADIDAVFPASASLTGQTIPLGPFVFTLVLNSTHALYALNATSTAPSSVGWMSVGQGSRMSNADYIIAWPSVSNSAINWTLSHRLPSGGDSHSVPSLASSSSSRSTADFYTLIPALTTTQTSSSYASVAWIRERTPPSTYPTTGSVSSSTLEQSKTSFIYGAASRNPKTTNEGTTSLAQHNLGYGSTSLDLAASFNATISQQIASGNGPVTSRTVVLAAHAVAGALAFAFISPAAVFIARLGRDWFAWYRPHLILQLATLVLVVVTFGLGVHGTTGGFFQDDHQRLGTIVCALALVQGALGWLGHRKPPHPLTGARPLRRPRTDTLDTRRPSFPWLRLAHICVGIVTLVLAWAQIWDGMNHEWAATSGAKAIPHGAKVAFWVVLVIWLALYAGAWALGIVMGPRRVARRAAASPDENRLTSASITPTQTLQGDQQGEYGLVEMGRDGTWTPQKQHNWR